MPLRAATCNVPTVGGRRPRFVTTPRLRALRPNRGRDSLVIGQTRRSTRADGVGDDRERLDTSCRPEYGRRTKDPRDPEDGPFPLIHHFLEIGEFLPYRNLGK